MHEDLLMRWRGPMRWRRPSILAIIETVIAAVLLVVALAMVLELAGAWNRLEGGDRAVRLTSLASVLAGIVALIGLEPMDGPVSADTFRGTSEDPSYPGLGEIKYVFNPSGYQFWFAPTQNIGPYVAGHGYHNVYKYELDDPSDWCGPVSIPNRAPYNAGDTAGQTAYYKIWDTTTDTIVCGSP